MNWLARTRENVGRYTELCLEHRHTEADFQKDFQRLAEIVRLVQSTADTAKLNAEKAAATLLQSRAIQETAAATQQRSAHLMELNLLRKGPIHVFPGLTPSVKTARHRHLAEMGSSALVLPAAAAHEINNPLEAIVSLLYILENDSALSGKSRECLAIIKGEVQRIADIAKESLANYRQTLIPEDIDVAEVINSVLDLYKSKFEAKGIAVIREHQFRGNIRAHSRQIREVLTNLFLNAIDAMNFRGHLRIRISAAREWSGQQRQGVRILVADNGNGIAPRHLHKIFEPSFTTKGKRGNGIGLSIVRDIIRAHRGTVRVRSSVRAGRSGTTFSIFLPADSRLNLVAA